MPNALAGTNGIFLVDTDGTIRSFVLRVVPSHGDNLIEVVVFDGNDVELGTPYRLKMTNSGHRIAGDTPGVNPAHFIVDANNFITNG